jgi:aminocarboxymuconate-semialdehyde decarboxylase
MTDLGMAGVQISSHVNSWNLNDPVLYPFWEVSCACCSAAWLPFTLATEQAAEETGAAVFVHPWDMMGKNEMDKVIHRGGSSAVQSD